MNAPPTAMNIYASTTTRINRHYARTRSADHPGWIEELTALGARSGMRELAVRGYVHRARLGNDSALAAAQMLSAGIENPALDELLLSQAASALD